MEALEPEEKIAQEQDGFRPVRAHEIRLQTSNTRQSSLYPIDVNWSRDSEHPRHLSVGIHCMVLIVLSLAKFEAQSYSFIKTLYIIYASAKNASE